MTNVINFSFWKGLQGEGAELRLCRHSSLICRLFVKTLISYSSSSPDNPPTDILWDGRSSHPFVAAALGWSVYSWCLCLPQELHLTPCPIFAATWGPGLLGICPPLPTLNGKLWLQNPSFLYGESFQAQSSLPKPPPPGPSLLQRRARRCNSMSQKSCGRYKWGNSGRKGDQSIRKFLSVSQGRLRAGVAGRDVQLSSRMG